MHQSSKLSRIINLKTKDGTNLSLPLHVKAQNMLSLILSCCNGTALQKWHLDMHIWGICILQRLNRTAVVEYKTIILGTDKQMVLLFLSTSERTKEEYVGFFYFFKNEFESYDINLCLYYSLLSKLMLQIENQMRIYKSQETSRSSLDKQIPIIIFRQSSHVSAVR